MILVCETGQTTRKAGLFLKKKEFDNLYSLQGGITKWKSDGMPVVKG